MDMNQYKLVVARREEEVGREVGDRQFGQIVGLGEARHRDNERTCHKVGEGEL